MEYRGYVLAHERGGLIKIEPQGKGSVHKELRGLYTRRSEAMRAVDVFLEAKKGKPEDGGPVSDS